MTDTEVRVSTPEAAGERSSPGPSARPQPLLLAGGIVAAVPAALGGGTPAAVVVVLGVVAAASVGLWLVLQRYELRHEQQRQAGLTLAFAAIGSLVLVLGTDERGLPEVYFLLAAAVICSLASIRDRVTRWLGQSALIAGVGYATVAADRPPLDIAVSVGLLLSVAVLVNLLAGELMAAQRSQMQAHADAERRTELLEAVRDLPGSSAEAAVEATIHTLRSLAFDAARVAVLRNGQLHEFGDGGWGDDGVTVPRGEGLKWLAIEEDRTITSPDYQRDGARRDVHRDVRSVVVAPIRVAGHPAGAVVGGRSDPGQPTPAEVEVAEVLAAHLGVVLDTETQVRRQRQLLERMADLDHMRSGFAREVSSELRDPLTIVRTVGEALTRHGDTIDPERRRMLLQQMCDHADDLRQTIDALLDFSRFQANREDAEIVSIPLVDLLAPVLRGTGASSEPPLPALRDLGPVVEADATLVRHALEILLVAGTSDLDEEPVGTLVLERSPGTDVVLHVVRHDGSVPSTLVRSLVSQLLVGGGASLADTSKPAVVLRSLGASEDAS